MIDYQFNALAAGLKLLNNALNQSPSLPVEEERAYVCPRCHQTTDHDELCPDCSEEYIESQHQHDGVFITNYEA